MSKVILEYLKWIILFISLILFAILAVSVYHKPAIGIDEYVYNFLSQKIISTEFTPKVQFITKFGSAIFLIVLAVGSLIFMKDKRMSLFVVLNLCLVSALNFVIKNVLQRERPIGFRLIEEKGFSFPSGHSMASFAFYGLFIYYIYKYLKNKYIKFISIFMLSVVVFCIGASRIYLGVHYTTDVLSGFILSLAYLIIFTSIVDVYLSENIEMKEKMVENNNQFYRNLFWYKSWLYKNIKFVSNDEDLEFNSILDALNIKKRNERIKYVYDYCCRKIDDYNKGKNICGFNENGQCYAQQIPDCDKKNGCCRLCAYQNSEGCQTSNIACKLFYCGQVTRRHKVIKFEDLKILKLLTFRQRVIIHDDYFTTREVVLMDLYIGSIIIYSIRMAIRLIINFINLKRHKLI